MGSGAAADEVAAEREDRAERGVGARGDVTGGHGGGSDPDGGGDVRQVGKRKAYIVVDDGDQIAHRVEEGSDLAERGAGTSFDQL